MSIYAIDWSHKEEKFAIYNGKKTTYSKPILKENDIVITENIPEKYIKDDLQKGVIVLRCSTNLCAAIRREFNLEKSDEIDVKIIWDMYKKDPGQFNPYHLKHPLSGLYENFKDIQKLRIATSNRQWDGSNTEYLTELENIEKKIVKQIEKELKKYPIWNKFLSKIKGVGPAIGCGLISYVGDIKRFKTYTHLNSYFGLGVKDNKAPKLKKGEIANWHQKGRSLLLGILSDQFVRQRTPKYRDIYEKEKVKQLEKLKDEKTCKGHAERRARRKSIKVFMRDFYRFYNKISSF